MQQTRFICSKCGECCRHIDVVPELKIYDNGDGVCIYLKDNMCSIYDSRPEVCRVDYMYNKMFANVYTLGEYYELNEKACKELIELKKRHH